MNRSATLLLGIVIGVLLAWRAQESSASSPISADSGTEAIGENTPQVVTQVTPRSMVADVAGNSPPQRFKRFLISLKRAVKVFIFVALGLAAGTVAQMMVDPNFDPETLWRPATWVLLLVSSLIGFLVKWIGWKDMGLEAPVMPTALALPAKVVVAPATEGGIAS